jgi:hypothetical protein
MIPKRCSPEASRGAVPSSARPARQKRHGRSFLEEGALASGERTSTSAAGGPPGPTAEELQEPIHVSFGCALQRAAHSVAHFVCMGPRGRRTWTSRGCGPGGPLSALTSARPNVPSVKPVILNRRSSGGGREGARSGGRRRIPCRRLTRQRSPSEGAGRASGGATRLTSSGLCRSASWKRRASLDAFASQPSSEPWLRYRRRSTPRLPACRCARSDARPRGGRSCCRFPHLRIQGRDRGNPPRGSGSLPDTWIGRRVRPPDEDSNRSCLLPALSPPAPGSRVRMIT